jgi:hypothetical protein
MDRLRADVLAVTVFGFFTKTVDKTATLRNSYVPQGA